jgi:hypothetical protein
MMPPRISRRDSATWPENSRPSAWRAPHLRCGLLQICSGGDRRQTGNNASFLQQRQVEALLADDEVARSSHTALAVRGASSSPAGSNSARSSGSGLPSVFATKRRCAMRDDGIPIVRQLCTVETGASISLATAEVPPK